MRSLTTSQQKGKIDVTVVSRTVVALLFVAAFVLVQPNCAFACSCVPPGTPAEELTQSDAVFQGRVVSVQTPNKPIESSADVTTITFETSKAWKGQITPTLTLTTPGSSASCGVTFEQGQEYVVYAHLNEGKLTTNLCSRTNTVANAAEDIAALGTGQAPMLYSQAPAQLPATGAADNNGMLSSTLLAILGILAVVAGVLVSVISQTRRVGKGSY